MDIYTLLFGAALLMPGFGFLFYLVKIARKR